MFLCFSFFVFSCQSNTRQKLSPIKMKEKKSKRQKVSEKTKQKEFFPFILISKLNVKNDDENKSERNQKHLFQSIQKGNPLFIEIVLCQMIIGSIKEEVVNTNNNKLNEVEVHEKMIRNKPSIGVVLFSFFEYFELLFSVKMKISFENYF